MNTISNVWSDGKSNPLEDLENAADEMRKAAHYKPPSIIERVFLARDRYLLSVIFLPRADQEKFYAEFNKLRMEIGTD